MATLNQQEIEPSGISPSFTAADSGGDQFEWDRRAVLYVKNEDSTSHTVTVAEQHSTAPAGYQEADLTVDVPAGEERLIGPFDREAYQDSDGYVQVSYDAVTSVEVAVLVVPQNR